MEAGWGTREFNQALADEIYPSHSDDPAFVEGYWRLVRHSITKADALANDRMWKDTDVRHVLPTIQAPTLVIHNLAIHEAPGAAEESRYIASHIPGAVFAETDPRRGEQIGEGVFPPIDQFLASLRAEEAEFDRVLATVMFTDIVDLNRPRRGPPRLRLAATDAGARSDSRANRGRYRGRETKTIGDRSLASEGPPAACDVPRRSWPRYSRSVIEIAQACTPVRWRSKVTTSRGLGVAIGARVGGLAGPSEVLVSSRSSDLVAGSGLDFEDRGDHELRASPTAGTFTGSCARRSRPVRRIVPAPSSGFVAGGNKSTFDVE